MINVNGTLYGGTACGGRFGKAICKKNGNGLCGQCKSLDASCKVTIVHSPGEPKDGEKSNAALLSSETAPS
jgi:hypothetical protein